MKSRRAWGSCGVRGISKEEPPWKARSGDLEPGLPPHVIRSVMCGGQGQLGRGGEVQAGVRLVEGQVGVFLPENQLVSETPGSGTG